MSFLDGLGDMLGNPLYESLTESSMDIHEEFSEALESATDVKLSEEDYAAILDDNNPDNQMADMSAGDEFKPDLGVTPEEAQDGSLESMIRSFKQMEQSTAEEALIRECEALEAASEDDDEDGATRPLPPMDPAVELEDGSELAGVNESDDGESESVSLESLLGAVFKV